LHGQPYYDKPPLLYWLIMSCYVVCGVHDWAARLVPSGAGFLTVLLAYAWARQVATPRAAFLGAAMLCLSARFVYLGRLLTMNSLLCLWVTASLAAAHLAMRDAAPRRRWWLASAVACGLGVLTKGPVALVLVLVPLSAFQLATPAAARLRFRHGLAYLAVAGAVAGPWYAAVMFRDPSFAGYFFWRHNLQRYVAPFDHAKPFGYYVPDLVLGMLPWTLLMPFLLWSLLRPRPCWNVEHARARTFFLLSAEQTIQVTAQRQGQQGHDRQNVPCPLGACQ
jgi:dolichol-phosphate mannosyltransferase